MNPFFDAYKNLGPVVGSFWGEFFRGMSQGITAIGGMTSLFAPLRESFSVAAAGAAPLAEALVRIGAIGGAYLPSMRRALLVLLTRLLNGRRLLTL